MTTETRIGPCARARARTFAAIAATLLLAPLTAASAASPTRVPADRPADVPFDYVVTPAGYFDPACVNAIGNDEIVRRDGRVLGADGAPRRRIAPCLRPHYTRRGVPVSAADAASAQAGAPAAMPPPSLNGYLVDAYFIDPAKPPRELDADFTVPAAPSAARDQIIYLFPGLVDYENEQTILQPVLAWNGFNDQAWSIASWNCCIDGNINHSDPVTVDAGDVIAGTMTGTACSANACSDWHVVSTDRGSGQSTTLNTTGDGQVFDWVFGAALEAYGVDNCAQLPATGRASFTSINALDMSGANSYGAYPWVGDFPGAAIFLDGFEGNSNCPYEVQYGGQPHGSTVVLSWSN